MVKTKAISYYLGGNMIIVFIAALVIFSRHSSWVFNGLDGEYMRILLQQQHAWLPLTINVGMNIFQGMGNIFLGYNFNVIPVIFLQNLMLGHTIPLLTFALFAVMLFASGYLWGRLFKIDKFCSLLGAWLLVILSLPFLGKLEWYGFFYLVPQNIDTIFFATVYLHLFARLGKTSDIKSNLPYMLGIILIPIYLVISNQICCIITAPVLAIVCAALLAFSTSLAEAKYKAAVILLGLIVWYFLGLVDFLYTNIKYSAAGFFPEELFQINTDLRGISVFFQEETTIGLQVIMLSIGGAVVNVISGTNDQRKMALLHLLITGLFIWILPKFNDIIAQLRGPQISYFEIIFWPGYTCYAVLGCVAVVRLVFWLLKKIKLDVVLPFLFDKYLLNSVLVFTGVGIYGYYLITLPVYSTALNYPPTPSIITEQIADNISVNYGEQFKGSVVNMTIAGKQEQPVSWYDLHSFDQLTVVKQLKNDHRYIGLWYFNIPTLSEYSQYISPTLYYVASRLLARPGDKQVRNHILYTSANGKLLQALGVRYIIADHHLQTGELVVTLPVEEGISLYLYELPWPNIGNYSPTRVIKVADAAAALALLQKNFNYRQTAIVTTGEEQQFAESVNAAIYPIKNGIRIEANSNQLAASLLPIQYSNCFVPKFGSQPESFSLQRANIAQMLVIFKGELKVDLTFENNFLNSSCRMQDLTEVQKLFNEVS